MKPDDAIKILRAPQKYSYAELGEALDAAIAALEDVKKKEESFEWCHDCRQYDQEEHCCHKWTKVINETLQDIEKRNACTRPGKTIPVAWLEAKMEKSSGFRHAVLSEALEEWEGEQNG